MNLRTLLQALALTLCVLLSTPADAVVYCVNSANTIVTAFNNANLAASGTTQDIRVRTGTYNFSSHLSFSDQVANDKEFSLTGGWNSDCSARTINPANTVFVGTGQSSSGISFSFTGDHRSFRIEGIRFDNFNQFFLFESICPFGQSCPDTDSIRVRYNHFRSGVRALIIANDSQTYVVSNNLFENLIGSADSSILATVNLSYVNEDAIPQVSFNTFSLGCNANKPAVLLHSQRSNALFSHNIVATSGCSDPLRVISADSGKAWVFRNNLYPAVNSGPLPAGGSGGNLIGVNPQFIGASDFRLRETAPVSPAINTGQTSIEAVQSGLSIPAQDLDGPAGARLVGSKYDMGAYESAVNDSSIITVTSTNDSGTGSLRSAIISANASPGLQKIHFNIPGSCTPNPHIIQLETPLPDITDSVEIDAYTEPGSAPNTSSLGTDAVLCVVVLAKIGTLAQALQVPNAAPAGTSLTVKGIAFAGSTGFNGNFSVALRLRGGSNHLIQGNAFAGIGPGDIGSLGEMNFGIQIRDSAQNVTIGGSEPEHRNSFGAMSSSAIVLNDATSGGHTIQNNYIGLSASGLAASPIGLNGIFASASPNVRILDNVIAAVPNNAAIAITGATATGYEIARNKLGTSAAGVPTAALRNSTGISIANGSGGHQIGGILNSAPSNTITNSLGAGVHLTSTAGNGTSVRPNRIFANGIDGVGLGIDLGALGPLENDSGDGDGGPNNGQNKPVITGSSVNVDGTRRVTGFLNTQPGQYIIDIYRSPDCPGGRGNMLNLIGTQFVTNVAGVVSVDLAVPSSGAPGLLTAVATRVSNGDTSEVSECFLEQHQTVTTIVSDNPDPSQFGETFNVIVQVSSSGGPPLGTVTVSAPGNQSCEAVLSPVATLGVGNCQLPTQFFGTTNSITASYPGNISFLPSNDTESHTGVAANTVTSILSDVPDPSQVGEPYTVTVQVRRQHDNFAPNVGTVTISDGTGQTCMTGTLSGGTASCQLTSVSAGNKTLTATYSGSAPFYLGSSGTATHTVIAAATTTTITSDLPDPSRVGEPYLVSVSVSSNGGTPSGTFQVNSGAAGASCQGTLNNGAGSCALTSNTAGQVLLTACMNANASFSGSCGNANHTVIKADTQVDFASLTPNPPSLGVPATVGVSLTVVAPGAGTPTGTIVVTLSPNNDQCVITLPATTCQLTATATGVLPISYFYSGDANFNSSLSGTVIEVSEDTLFKNGFE